MINIVCDLRKQHPGIALIFVHKPVLYFSSLDCLVKIFQFFFKRAQSFASQTTSFAMFKSIAKNLAEALHVLVLFCSIWKVQIVCKIFVQHCSTITTCNDTWSWISLSLTQYYTCLTLMEVHMYMCRAFVSHVMIMVLVQIHVYSQVMNNSNSHFIGHKMVWQQNTPK